MRWGRLQQVTELMAENLPGAGDYHPQLEALWPVYRQFSIQFGAHLISCISIYFIQTYMVIYISLF